MTITIKDIAKKAGVSYATVSRAIGNKYGVKPETREKIEAVARQLGYTPNGIARGLVSKQTNTIGLIIPDINNPFFPMVVRGIEEVAHAHGYSIFLCNSDYDVQRERHYLSLLIEKRVDGIILMPGGDPHDQGPANTNEVPMVFVCREIFEADKSFVVIDDERGGFLATKHLIEQGYGSIGFIGSTNQDSTTGVRFRGYQLAFKKFGIPLNDAYIIAGDFKWEIGHRIVTEMIAQKKAPRAIFAENDFMALGIIQGVQEAGLKIPNDIAIVGFDDIPFATFPGINLTTIRQPKYKMGKIAANILMDQIAGKSHESKRVIIEPELIIRQSSCSAHAAEAMG
jgi:LacI family transcriptional regulator